MGKNNNCILMENFVIKFLFLPQNTFLKRFFFAMKLKKYLIVIV